jgi:hypothetical protein
VQDKIQEGPEEQSQNREQKKFGKMLVDLIRGSHSDRKMVGF